MAKLSIQLILVTIFTVFQSCKTDEQICNVNLEIKDSKHLVDISVLKMVPQILDTLAKYPELQVTSIINDEYYIGVICDYFYNGLICFNNSYSIGKSKKQNFWHYQDSRPKVTLSNNLSKKIDAQKAIDIAKKEIDFRGNCLTYQLGYYYSDTSGLETPTNYKLVWNIKSYGGSATVFLDANSGHIYHKFDGIIN